MAKTGPKPRPVEDRFFEKIAPKNDKGCIEWTAGTNGVGYGTLKVKGEQGHKHVYAHRWFYEYHRGEIPEGLHIDHLCRNTLCVNHEHLEAVTPKENLIRGVGFSGINARKTHCIRGHELAGDNLYIYPNGGRYCRACERHRDREKREKLPPKEKQQYCKRGHPLFGDNLYTPPSGRRVCRECKRMHGRKQDAKRKERKAL